MRLIGRGLLVLLLLTLGLWFGLSLDPRESRLALDSGHWIGSSLPDDAHGSTIFWLTPEQALHFSVPSNVSAIRILAHLESPIAQSEYAEEQAFAIRYQLEDEVKKNEADAAKVYHFTTHFPDFVTLGGRDVPTRFYSRASHLPSSDQRLFLPLESAAKARVLSLHWHNAAANDLRIGVRVAVEEHRSDNQAAIMWQRLSDEERNRVLSGHIFPPHLASAEEKLEAMRKRWLPIGPSGAVGEDFQSDTLFVLSSPPPPSPDGERAISLLARQDKDVSLPVEEGAYELHLRVQTGHEKEQEPPQAPLVQLYPDDGRIARTLQLIPSAQGWRWQGDLGAGLIRISSPIPVEVSLNDGRKDIIAAPNYVPAFVGGTPLNYTLSAASDRPQALRVDLRQWSKSDPLDPRVRRILLRVYDDKGKQLQNFERELIPQKSPFQRLDNKNALRISGSSSLFLMAPAGASRLELDAGPDTLLTVYARPDAAPMVRELPQQRRPWRQSAERLPIWTILRPQEAPALRAAERRQSIRWFYAPIENTSSREDSIWDPLKTVNSMAQKSLLFPSKLEQEPDPKALQNIFVPLPRLREYTFASAYNNASLEASLIYRRLNESPSRIEVQWNNEPWLTRSVTGLSGQLNLPARRAGKALIKHQGEGMWWINRVLPESPPHDHEVFRLHRAYPLATPLSFVVQKRNKNVILGLNIFAPTESPELELKIKLIFTRETGLSDSYTVPSREIRIRAQQMSAFSIGNGENWGAPVYISVPLGADLPDGSYQLDLSISEGSPAQRALVSGGYATVGQNSLRSYWELNDGD